MSNKSVKQECLARALRNSVKQRVSYKSVLQDCHLSVSTQGVSQVGSFENVRNKYCLSVPQHTCRHSGSWVSSCFLLPPTSPCPEQRRAAVRRAPAPSRCRRRPARQAPPTRRRTAMSLGVSGSHKNSGLFTWNVTFWFCYVYFLVIIFFIIEIVWYCWNWLIGVICFWCLLNVGWFFDSDTDM